MDIIITFSDKQLIISIMKKLKIVSMFVLTLFSVICLLFSCSKDSQYFVVDTESATLEKISNIKLVDIVDQNKIEVTTDYVKNKWEKALIDEGDNVKLEKFKILESFDKINNTKVYFLKAVSSDGTVETGAFMTLTDEAGVYVLGKKICKCVGCPTGCHLVVTGNDCDCSPCTGSNKACTKTEEVVIE